jgi:hypothetical protein
MKHNDWRDVYMRIIITVVQNKDLALPTLTVFARILSLPMIVVNPFEHLSLHNPCECFIVHSVGRGVRVGINQVFPSTELPSTRQ